MYNPWAGERYEIVEPVTGPQWLLQDSEVRRVSSQRFEYIELFNDGGEKNISGWSFSSGIEFAFPAGAVIPAQGRVVACRDRDAFLEAYPGCDPAYVFGNWSEELHNAADTVLLKNASGSVVEVLSYKDAEPWDCLADGFGASLERVCFTASAMEPDNWRAGEVPYEKSSFGGTPLRASAFDEACPPAEVSRPPVKISEIHYHPLLEASFNEFHEFVEIVNTGEAAVPLGGWRLVGGIRYTFPDVELEAGGRLVIAYDRDALLSVEGYSLDPSRVIGDYADGGYELDNGGDRIALVTSAGVGVDAVKYDDDFPWPVASDGLGAGAAWLSSEYVDAEGRIKEVYRHRGPSLERVSFSVSASSPANWIASPVDGATPGAPNSVQRETPRAVVEDIRLEPETLPSGAVFDDPIFYASDNVKIEVRFSSLSSVSQVVVEYFIEDIERVDETRHTMALADNGEAPDEFQDDLVFTGLFPPQEAGSIVRYRFKADRGDGEEVVSPRPSDPYGWFAYYITPKVETDTPIYEISISRSNWGRMYTNASGGRVSGCLARPQWDAKVPAVFVYKGVVYDVLVRYQGSRWNRLNGAAINTSRWPYPRPSAGTFQAYSWHINFPRYNRMEGLRVVLLNKLTQSCPGYTYAVGMRLFREAGVPAHNCRFVRLHVNGGYYRYMLHLERGGEDMMENWVRRWNLERPGGPPDSLGFLFKSAGCNCNEGPYGWGDERRLTAYCGYTALERYEYTYGPKTHDWAGAAAIMDMIEELNDARDQGDAAVRDFFETNFDMRLLTDYICIINWAVPFDDMFQNHFLYQRRIDGKWLLMPWDLDLDFGDWQGAGSSIYMGELGDSSNRSGWWNYLKDAYLKAFRSEYHERLRALNNTILTADFIHPLVDRVLAAADPAEANQAASPMSCSFYTDATSFKNFASTRHAVVNQRVPSVSVTLGEDFSCYVGETILFDAGASYPDPEEGAVYTWSNGLEGDASEYMFTEPGTYEIELVVSYEGKEASDEVVVTVLQQPGWIFEEADGLVVIEAESFHENLSKDNSECWWEQASAMENFAGDGYMFAGDVHDISERSTYFRDYTAESPELRYFIRFSQTGTYRLWVRGFPDNRLWDSVHVGVDGEGSTSYTYQMFSVPSGTPQWQWCGDNRDGAQEFEIPSPGTYFFSFWIRESKFSVDRFLFTTDADFVPEGAGPPESVEITLAGEGSFVRGDVNGDRVFDLSDPVTLLLQLFSGFPITCEDYSDINDDGSLDLSDAVYLLQYLFGGGAVPPEPFPAPGYDTTDDPFSCGSPPN